MKPNKLYLLIYFISLFFLCICSLKLQNLTENKTNSQKQNFDNINNLNLQPVEISKLKIKLKKI